MDLENGQVYEMQGSGKNPYKIKNVGGVYSCTCPAWLNQSLPSNARTCKHIRKLRADPVEEARLASAGTLERTQVPGVRRARDVRPVRGPVEVPGRRGAVVEVAVHVPGRSRRLQGQQPP